MTTDHAAQPTIRDDVLALCAAAGFEVRDGAGYCAICGTVDSAAILIEMLLYGVLLGVDYSEGEEHAN